MGSPEFAVYPLEQLLLNGHQIIAVYTPPDKMAGRGKSTAGTAVKKVAIAQGLRVFQEANIKRSDAVERLALLRPDVVVVAAFGQLLPQAVLDIPCYGCLNIHPSLLPRYRGSSPVSAAILAGDEFAGVSVMRLDAGMDTGPIYSRSQIPVLAQDTTASLTSRLFMIGAWMVLELLAEIPGGKVLAEPQNNEAASYTKELSKENGHINWRITATEIWRQVRAYQPWPAAYTYWQGKQLKIIEALPLHNAASSAEAGSVVPLPADKENTAPFAVSTGTGLLGILKVQIEGKRAMTGSEFLRGQREFMGARLG